MSHEYILRTVRGIVILDLFEVTNIIKLKPSLHLPTFDRILIELQDADTHAIFYLEPSQYQALMYHWELPQMTKLHEDEKEEETCYHEDIDLSIFQN